MIDDRLLEGAPSILKGMVKHYRPVASAHPSVRKGANFCGRTNHGVGSEIGRRRQNFGVCRYRFVVEKDLTDFVRFENKIVLFSGIMC